MSHQPHPYVVDWSEKVAGLVELARDDQQWYEELARWLLRPGDRVAVDVGSGGGGMTLALAAALAAQGDAAQGDAAQGDAGRVVAVDGEPELLAAVRDRVAAQPAGRLARVDLVTADLEDGIGPVRTALDPPADLVWAAFSVHHVGDQQATVDALASLLAPGGRLALVEGGLSARHLPWDLGVGEPGLEVRLEAATDRWFARMRAELPGSARMPYDWSEALRRAGLGEVTTRTTLRERPAPLDPADRERVVHRLVRWVDRVRPTGFLDPADLAAWDRLLDPDDPAWLGQRTDLYRLDARSVHLGVRPEPGNRKSTVWYGPRRRATISDAYRTIDPVQWDPLVRVAEWQTR